MNLPTLKSLLTSHLNEMASTNSYETKSKALALLDAAFELGVSTGVEASSKYSAKVKPASGDKAGRVPSRD